MNKTFRVIIPAGGRSSRSGLSYPKSLYRLEGIPILIRIFNIVEHYDPHPILIINPAHKPLFDEVLLEFNKSAEFVYQNEPKGMGNAVLQAYDKVDDDTHLILVWSDIPLLSKHTVEHLIKCHLACRNNFSLATSIGSNCYTIVDRNEDGKLIGVKETRALGIEPAKEGERDIGLFAFQKQPLFDLLKKDAAQVDSSDGKEHGFLYAIEHLVEAGKKVEGYPIALSNDVLSFNTPEDLKQIENQIRS